MDANLRAQYEAKFGKKPFMGWSDEKLKELIEDPTTVVNLTTPAVDSVTTTAVLSDVQDPEGQPEPNPVDPEEKARMEEAAIINARAQNASLPANNKVPVFMNGAAYGIIDNKYVPWDEAQVVFQKAQIVFEQKKLAELEAAVEHNKQQAEELKNLQSNLPSNS
jgi:hypothetical protein